MTQPGVAKRTIDELVAASGSIQVVMVDVRRNEATVSVLKDREIHTWAYRDGRIREVASDLQYVNQLTFTPDSFDLADISVLFRTAAAVSGSDQTQILQIVDRQQVDHALSDIKMSVSTNPETRTVFFNADGTLVPTLDFSTLGGISRGLSDAIGTHVTATTVSVGSPAGASIEFPGADGTTTVRRQRTAKFPVTDSPRSGSDKQALFDPHLVDPTAIWRVLQRYAAAGTYTPATDWSVSVDAKSQSGVPRMRFTVGQARFVTDLAGTEVTQ